MKKREEVIEALLKGAKSGGEYVTVRREDLLLALGEPEQEKTPKSKAKPHAEQD